MNPDNTPCYAISQGDEVHTEVQNIDGEYDVASTWRMWFIASFGLYIGVYILIAVLVIMDK